MLSSSGTKQIMVVRSFILSCKSEDLASHSTLFREFWMSRGSQSPVRNAVGNGNTYGINGRSQIICGIVIGVNIKTNNIVHLLTIEVAESWLPRDLMRPRKR